MCVCVSSLFMPITNFFFTIFIFFIHKNHIIKSLINHLLIDLSIYLSADLDSFSYIDEDTNLEFTDEHIFTMYLASKFVICFLISLYPTVFNSIHPKVFYQLNYEINKRIIPGVCKYSKQQIVPLNSYTFFSNRKSVLPRNPTNQQNILSYSLILSKLHLKKIYLHSTFVTITSTTIKNLNPTKLYNRRKFEEGIYSIAFNNRHK